MAVPAFWVKVGAAGNVPFNSAPTFTDITTDVREMSWSRGRGSSLDEIGAGGGTLRLRNKTRQWEPGFAASAYQPIRPYRIVNIGCTWNSVDYSLFYGFAETWNVVWDRDWGTAYSEVEVQLVDAIALLANSPGTTAAGTFVTSARIGTQLTAAAFPAGMRDITGGLGVLTKIASPTLVTEPAELQPVQFGVAGGRSGTASVWEMIQAFVRTYGSDVPCFIDRRGYAVYKATVGSGLTFGDSQPSELKYTALNLNYGIDQVYNVVEVTAEGGVTQSVADATSISRYRNRPLSRATYNTSDAEALVVANALLTRYKEPKVRLEGFQVQPGTTSALWDAVVTLDLEHTFTVNRRPPGGGTMFSQTQKVVGLNWNVSGPAQQTTIGYTLTGATL